jgi:hypothetical protein
MHYEICAKIMASFPPNGLDVHPFHAAVNTIISLPPRLAQPSASSIHPPDLGYKSETSLTGRQNKS